MKILLISSSPHKEKSKTFILAKEVLRGACQQGDNCESLHLDDFQLLFCKHCQECHKKILRCSLPDKVSFIIKKMLEADGIVLASPNYINQLTASMKALFDRTAHFIHCKRLLDKYVAGVVSSGSGQDKAVLHYIRFYGHICGAQYSGGISSAAHLVQQNKNEAFDLGKKLAADIKEKKVYPEQMRLIEKGKEHFKEIIKARKQDWPEEYRYWQDKGWL